MCKPFNSHSSVLYSVVGLMELKREAPGFEFPPIVSCCAGGRVYGETVSQPLLFTLIFFSFSNLPNV